MCDGRCTFDATSSSLRCGDCGAPPGAPAATAASFNGILVDWDTSKVTVVGTFSAAFNHQLNWDTSNVKTMGSTFQQASAFNTPLVWDTSQVTSLHQVFSFAEDFDQPLAWDTSRVKSVYSAFAGTKAFNQPLGDWDTNNVILAGAIFWEADAFDCNNVAAWALPTSAFGQYDKCAQEMGP